MIGGHPRVITDAELACALMGGESWAIAETWYRFAPMVLTLAERALGSRTEAEDVAQEVFVRLFQRANTLRDPNSLRSFVYSFAVRVVRSELRRRRVRGWFPFLRGEMSEEESGPAMDFESRDLLAKMYALLDRLTARDRLVFVLRRLESKTVEEIAETLDLSPSTVKRSMAYASRRLSTWIDRDPSLAGLLREQRWGI